MGIAGLCDDKDYPKLGKEACPKTCGKCEELGECNDKGGEQCLKFKQFCEQKSQLGDYARENCKFTCNKCNTDGSTGGSDKKISKVGSK